MRVLVVDDHDLFRAGLAALLDDQPGIAVIAQASSGRAGVRLARELAPDVILMDIRMADLGGPDATREIIADQPDARILALTIATEDHEIADALRAGACGFLAKDTPISSVVAAIEMAAEGAAWLSPKAAELVLAYVRRSPEPGSAELEPSEQLSARELDVLRLIAAGKENAEIAAALNISPRTAKNHVSNILAKLHLPSRVQAAVYAVRHGLL